jgi:hypothetical protein
VAALASVLAVAPVPPAPSALTVVTAPMLSPLLANSALASADLSFLPLPDLLSLCRRALEPM